MVPQPIGEISGDAGFPVFGECFEEHPNREGYPPVDCASDLAVELMDCTPTTCWSLFAVELGWLIAGTRSLLVQVRSTTSIPQLGRVDGPSPHEWSLWSGVSRFATFRAAALRWLHPCEGGALDDARCGARVSDGTLQLFSLLSCAPLRARLPSTRANLVSDQASDRGLRLDGICLKWQTHGLRPWFEFFKLC